MDQSVKTSNKRFKLNASPEVILNIFFFKKNLSALVNVHINLVHFKTMISQYGGIKSVSLDNLLGKFVYQVNQESSLFHPPTIVLFNQSR